MNGPDWRECQQYLDEQQFQLLMKEECEHGIHKDSGRQCFECQAEKADYEGLLRADPAYQEWLDELDKPAQEYEHELGRTR